LKKLGMLLLAGFVSVVHVFCCGLQVAYGRYTQAGGKADN